MVTNIVGNLNPRHSVTSYKVMIKSILFELLLLHCALSLAAECIVIGPVCVFVCSVGLCVCLWVCYHDNSKCVDLRALILTKLGL